MLAVITRGNGDVALENIPQPVPGEYECLCKITACATCSGTDRKIIRRGFGWANEFPAILGHESVGTIIACGSKVRNYKVGDRVLRPAVTLPWTNFAGYASFMGGFAEYGVVVDMKEKGYNGLIDIYPRYQQIVPADITISDADATMMIMLKEVAGSCKAAAITPGSTVLVLGSGSVAQAMCFFAKYFGAGKVIAAARRREPLALCAAVGADVTVTLDGDELETRVAELTGDRGVNYILDAAGGVDLLVRAGRMLADGGFIASYASMPNGKFPNELICGKGSWRMAPPQIPEHEMHNFICDLLRKGELDPKKFYTHTIKFTDFVSGFQLLEERKAGKIVFTM